MLALPEVGVSARSVNNHNNKLNALCDWVEASLLFGTSELSRSEVVDVLLENQLYESQDLAHERVEQVWSVIAERSRYLQSPLGMQVVGNRITKTQPWTRFPAYGFCMALALSELYPTWAKGWDTPASTQGAIFEELTEHSFARTLVGWHVERIGWTPGIPTKLRTVLPGLIAKLNERDGAEIDLHVDANTNELGLDVLAFCSYDDLHASIPVLLIQCASGKNWVTKRQTPDFSIWTKVISFNSQPVRGFAIPFAFADQLEFRKEATSVSGVFMDRNRLLGAFRRRPGTMPVGLNRKLSAWTRAQVRTLPGA